MAKKQKKTMRQEMAKIVANLDLRWSKAASKELCDRLDQLFQQEIGDRVTHVLAWMNSSEEQPDLSLFIEKQIGIREVYLPSFYEDGKLAFNKLDRHLFEAGQGLSKSVMEDSPYDFSDAANSVIIIPGLAFDKMGNRLGWGELHYERFMSNSQLKEIVKVGIAWSIQVVNEVPVESMDLIVDWLVTERELENTAVLFRSDVS